MLYFGHILRRVFWQNRKLWRLWHWTEGAMDAPVDSTVIHTATGTTEPARL